MVIFVTAVEIDFEKVAVALVLLFTLRTFTVADINMVLSGEERRERNRLAAQRSRARESREAREERLRKQRERARVARATQPPAAIRGICETSANNEYQAWGDGDIPKLRPVSDAAKRSCLQRLRLALGAVGLDEVACAVCDRSEVRTSCRVVTALDSDIMEQFHQLLSSADEAVPDELVSEYDCSHLNSSLRGLLLSKRGFRSDGSLYICQECERSLAKRLIPKFSIKNGFYVGTLPSRFVDITLPERLMTQMVSVVAVTRVMRGGVHRTIRSHCLVFDATPGPPATLLPIPVSNLASYRVVLAGPFTTEQQACVRQMHCVRREMVNDILMFYRQHNALYDSVVVNCGGLPDHTIAENLIFEDPDADIEVSEIEREHDRVGGVSENDASSTETDVLERRVVFISDDREVSAENAGVATGDSCQSESQSQFLVRHSSQFAQKDKVLFARMFPHLFPYGRGHPDEPRHIPVSFDACIRYYAQLSTRLFAEDELFMLVSFDYLSVQKMYTQVALKCQRNPALFEPYSDITEEDLVEALGEKELWRQGRTTSMRDGNTSAANFLKTVELSGSSMWGSDAERAQCRRRAFAYQARFGQPALFVTLTPNVADSFVMARYCKITSVETLFDAALADIPDKSTLHSACMRNDVASARLFMRNMDAFIEHVLGVAPKHMKNIPFEGLFGDVKAYFGMIETQGGGTLHAHFLIWLDDAPPNSDAFERAVVVHGDQYYRDLEAYADSVVTTTMPLRVANSSCVFCGHSFADLEELPIPPEAYEDPKKQHEGVRGEPALLRCSECRNVFSSQHVIRCLLLENRPSSWPPEMRSYSSDELKTKVQLEAPCRGGVAAAKVAIYRHDMYLHTMNPDSNNDVYGEYLRDLNQIPCRLERRQDDAFRDDKIAQAIMILPPSVDDARWLPRIVSFAVSMLVFMLNLHWWSHAGSCFKKSRVSRPGQCRYGFPRARSKQTVCSRDGIVLARRSPFEFVNGFNCEMMLTFKSNHDIQVMIGGLNALQRIYYATKYVTKMQEQIDSITAVALAAFKRRQVRETLDDVSHDVDRVAVGRRRVASLVYAITNRREIAGPLAALYVLRGSCAYMSTPCASLPLRNVLNELVEGVPHSCDLVRLQRQSSDVTFRAASFLDDYLFRPRSLDNVSLYEYVAKHFRRKKTLSTVESVLFLPDHPHFNSHCVGTHIDEVVPVVSGIQMPFVDSESPFELVVKRSQCALVLFKPFRTVKDLVSNATDNAKWLEAFLQWQPTRSSFTCEIMANMDDYYRATKQAKECSAANDDAEVPTDNNTDNDELVGTREDVDAVLNHEDESESDVPGTSRFDTFCRCFNNKCGDDNGDNDNESPAAFALESTLPIFPNSGSTISSDGYQHLLNNAAQRTVNEVADVRSYSLTFDFSVDELQRFVSDTSNDETTPHCLNRYCNERPTEVIEHIENTLKSVPQWPPLNQQSPQPPPPLRAYASIEDVARAFTLNKRQYVAFTLIATSLLRRFLHQELGSVRGNSDGYRTDKFEAQFRHDQLLMFLGGAGGTGKSRVIETIDAFCASWQREYSVVKTALTGKAATLIGGRTLASFMMRLQRDINEKHFSPLDLIVIDEVSMMSKVELLRLDRLLRRYKHISAVPFGGVHVVLVGDFLQMPPVKADPIYRDPTEKVKAKTTDIEGFDLWRRFTTVVILEESVRFRSDPEWGAGCSLARLGQWTPEFINLINSRVITRHERGSTALPVLQNDIDSNAVFVTPENATRLAVNNEFVTKTASMLPTNMFPVRVIANFKGSLNGLSQSDLRYVMSLPDSRFGRMAPYLDLIGGMPIQITQNIATSKGVANGTLGTLVCVHFPPNTSFQLVRDGASNTIVQLPSKPPEYAMVRIPRPQATAIRAGVDPELFPVFFKTEAYMKSTITLPKAPDGQPRSITVKPQQLPFVCAVGSTVYKVQGETLTSMVVMDWKSTQRVVNKPQQSYLLVSRVTSRNAFIALTPFTHELAAWSKPPVCALNEEERLIRLSNITLASFNHHRFFTQTPPPWKRETLRSMLIMHLSARRPGES